MTIKITPSGEILGGKSDREALVAAAQSIARNAIAGSTAMTDSGSGDVSASKTLTAITRTFTDTTGTGTQTPAADVTTWTGEVLDGLDAFYDAVNAHLTTLGLPTITNSLGGTATANTFPDTETAVTAANTGITAANLTSVVAVVNKGFYHLGVAINRLCHATGNTPLTFAAADRVTFTSTVTGSIAVGSDTASSVAATAFAALQSDVADNIATMVDAYNDCLNTSAGADHPLIAVQG